MRAFADQVFVDIAQNRAEAIGVVMDPCRPFAVAGLQPVGAVPGQGAHERARHTRDRLQGCRLGPVLQGAELRRVGLEGADRAPGWPVMGAQHRERIVMGAVAHPRQRLGKRAVDLRGGAR